VPAKQLQMPKFLFWNIGRNVSPKLVGDVAAERDVDIVVLAETGCDDSIFLDHLNDGADRLYYRDQGYSKSVTALAAVTP
jgi:hypothetical protein